MKELKKVTIGSVLGNTLELYDFTLYGIFAPVLAPLFFPKADPMVSLLATLGIFAVGFIARPLGGLLFGHLGDRFGRKKSLTLSMMMMAIPTFIIGALPTYESIGILAPCVLMVCRLLQGLCAGGEYIGASIYLVEHYQTHSLPGFAGGLLAATGALGALMAMILGFFLLQWDVEWGWRVPFFLGGSLGFVGLYIRNRLQESPEFLKFLKNRSAPTISIGDVLKKYPRSMLCSIGEGIFQGGLAYGIFVYINIHLNKHLGLAIHHSMILSTCALISYIFMVPLLGWVADYKGYRLTMLYGALLNMACLYPIFLLLHTANFLWIATGLISLSFVAACFIGPANAFLCGLFPVGVRYRGVAFGYGLGSAFSAGLMPFLSTFLIDRTHNLMMPALFLMVGSFIGFISVYAARVTHLASEETPPLSPAVSLQAA